MSPFRFKGMAAIYAVVCSLCPLIPAAGQTGIPLGVELSGYTAIPSNNVGSVICGRLWLDGTNLAYRFAASAVRSISFVGSAVELKGPASPDTNGPLLYVLNSFAGSVPPISACDAAAGITIILDPQDPPPPPGPRIAEGTISIALEQIPQILDGRWYAHAIGRPARGSPDQTFEVRGQIRLLDSDADGVPDYLDHCANTPPGSLINSKGCTIEQLCPCASPWRNHGDYVSYLKQVLEEFVQEGLLDREQSRLLFQSGAQSDCGRLIPDEPSTPSP